MAVAGVDAVDPTAPSPSHAPPASRKDLQTAIAKAVELRQLHAALLQRGGAANTHAGAGASPTVIRLPPVAASPARSRTADEGYPVFTPVSHHPSGTPAGLVGFAAQLNRIIVVTDNARSFWDDRFTTRWMSAWPG